jgi:hypothetical protein
VIALSELIERFEPALVQRYGPRLLPSQHQALAAMKRCRTRFAPRMLAQCAACGEQRSVPHSCGHRACPHCQHHDSQVWLQRQLHSLVPATYFLVTFTLPSELRGLAFSHQRVVYALLMQCAWETLATFSRNDAKLRATPGAVGVLHTHNRRLDLHPHVHMVMPAAALDTRRRLWRTKTRRTAAKTQAGKAGKAAGGGYLFNHKALAKVFRAKLLDAIEHAGLTLPAALPDAWVVDCRCVGDGSKALLYLSRYLYRGVIQERDILRCDAAGNVTFRYRDAKTDKMAVRTLPGADFLWLVLQHVLPKGLRRSRNFGFLHPNSATAIRLLQVLHLRAAPRVSAADATMATPPRPAWRCACGQPMHVVRRRMAAMSPQTPPTPPTPQPVRVTLPDKPDAAQAETMH